MLKSELLGMESHKVGRVRLADFYRKGLTGVFQFNEKIDYLRVLGALDESDPAEPYVIVPNYVMSRPNCLVPSSFYAICCQNECEDLLGKLENGIGAETVAPERVLELVATLSTDTVPAGRKLADTPSGRTLIQRLHSMAKSNGGKVPLHGRLFAQWMHHVFPRECPFPHESNTNPQTPDEWMRDTGAESAKASVDEVMEHVSRVSDEKAQGAAARQYHNSLESDLPWSEAEEMFGIRTSTPVSLETSHPMRNVAVFVMVCSMVSGFLWAVKQDTGKLEGCSISMDSGKIVGKMA
jgi:hypothetical protein